MSANTNGLGKPGEKLLRKRKPDFSLSPRSFFKTFLTNMCARYLLAYGINSLNRNLEIIGLPSF